MINLLSILLDRLVARVRSDERGELSIEYVLIAGLVSIAIIAGMAALTPALSSWFGALVAEINSALPG